MGKSGVPDWFGKEEEQASKRRGSANRTEAAKQAAGGPGPSGPNRPALLGVIAAVILIGAIVPFVLMRPSQSQNDDDAEREARVQQEEQAKRARMLEAIKKAAEETPEPIEPDPEEVPSIEDVLKETEGEVEGAEGDEATDAAATQRDAASVLEVVRKMNPNVRACYDVETKTNPGASGRIQLSLTINERGEVIAARADAPEDLTPKLANCVAAVYRNARFEPASDVTTVNIPIVLSADPGN